MQFCVSRSLLLQGLSTVQDVVNVRTTLPILSNVLLQASDTEIRLTATDLGIGIRGTVKAEIKRTGATTLPARKLFEIIKQLPTEDIYFDVDSNNASSIRSGSSVFKLLGLPEDEFPPLADLGVAKEFTLSQKKLKDGLKKTSCAMSTDHARYLLNGMLFSFKDNKLTLVATDGRRLALVDLGLEFLPGQEMNIIVPSKTVAELQRLIRGDSDVKIRVNGNQISFEMNNILLVSNLVEGNYPNYRQVIPAEFKERITLEREPFSNAVSRVSLLAIDKSASVTLIFSKNNIDIVANTPDVGEAKESSTLIYQGREFSIAFNPQFLKDAFSNLDEDEVQVDIIDGNSPFVVRLSPFLYVLMPLRVS